MIMKPNRLGWITSLKFENSIDELMKGSIDFIAEDAGALHEYMIELSHGGIHRPVFQKEFMCLYCGTPNNIEHPSCQKCGAPRSFVIG